MSVSRRELSGVLLALTASNVAAQQPAATPMPSKVFHNAELPYRGDDKKKGRQFFHGPNRSGFRLEMHESILGPGIENHAPHKHEHEEIVVVLEGAATTMCDGKTEVAQAGSVIYIASNLMHNLKNAGSTPCRYYIVELRG